MIVAMLLAHLVGDYLLQWDALANAKSKSMQGVLAHGSIVLVVTLLFALAFDPGWWPWALFIGVIHTFIDAIPLKLVRHLPTQHGLFALARLLIDQLAHFSVIGLALISSGYVTLPALIPSLISALHTQRGLAFALGYAFIAMPAWVLVEFAAYGLINGSAPDFSHAVKNKYIGTLERGLIATLVILGQFTLVPLIALPRLVFDSPNIIGSQRAAVYMAEWLASLTLAILIGLGLSRL